MSDNSTAAVDWHGQLVEQLDWHWRFHARPRLDGLSDEEYRWEPVADCWNVRPRGYRHGADAGRIRGRSRVTSPSRSRTHHP